MEQSAAGRGSPRTLIFELRSITQRFDLRAMFPREQPVEVELGSGDGSFLAAYAALHPERNFLGVERLLGRLRKLDRKGLRRRLQNLRIVRVEAHYLAQYLLPPGSISALHIYFPDPWPKRKHRKNRLVTEEFTRVLAQALVPGGIVYLRTDDRDYFSQMAAAFAANPAFGLVETPVELQEVLTDFEKGFLARGVTTCRAAYQLR